MCPLCIGTATLLVSGGTSAGGIAAVVLRHLGRQHRQAVLRSVEGDMTSPRTFNVAANNRGSLPPQSLSGVGSVIRDSV
jgi:hypothetical protein